MPMAGAPITLYLIRHGLAAERGDEWPDDRLRPLVPDGMRRLRQETRGLAALGVTLDLVLTSPLVRARQTAEIVAAGLAPHPPLQALESLSPGTPVATVLADLAKHVRRSNVAVVGHEPDLGRLAARLLGTRRALEFKKGAICCVEVEALPVIGPGLLKWFATPRMLRRLAG